MNLTLRQKSRRRSAARTQPARNSFSSEPRIVWIAGRGWVNPDASPRPASAYVPAWLTPHKWRIQPPPGGPAIKDADIEAALIPGAYNLAVDPARALFLAHVRAQIDLIKRLIGEGML